MKHCQICTFCANLKLVLFSLSAENMQVAWQSFYEGRYKANFMQLKSTVFSKSNLKHLISRYILN